MAKIVWTELALSNLESVFWYIEQDSAQYAGLVVEKILDSVKMLETFPEYGRKVPETNDDLVREVIHDNFRIVYQLRNEAIEILTIHHCSKDFDPDHFLP